MTTFQYEALNTDGKSVGGRVDAESARKAQRILRKRGLSPISVNEAVEAQAATRRKKRSNIRDRVLMLKEMAVLIEAGVQLAETVDSLAKSRAENDLRTALTNVSRDIRQGNTLTAAFRAHFSFLPTYVHQLIEAGEVTGQLKGSLKDAVLQMEYDNKVSKEVREALAYPTFLILMSVSSVMFIFIVVVPRFAEMVKDRFNSLPFLSKLVLGTGVWVRDNVLFMALVAAIIVGLGIYAWTRKTWRVAVYDRSLSFPVIGKWLTETETARWTAMMATLLTNKIPLLKALELARGAVMAPSLDIRLAQAERMVRGGTPLSGALAEYVAFPTAVVNLIRVGERAGNLAEMMRTAAQMTEESTRTRMAQALSILEPGAVLFIGGFVGLIVVAIFTAITSVNQIPI